MAQESVSESDSVSDCSSEGFLLFVLASIGGSSSSSVALSSSPSSLDLSSVSSCMEASPSTFSHELSRIEDLKISGLQNWAASSTKMEPPRKKQLDYQSTSLNSSKQSSIRTIWLKKEKGKTKNEMCPPFSTYFIFANSRPYIGQF